MTTHYWKSDAQEVTQGEEERRAGEEQEEIIPGSCGSVDWVPAC